ncbi:hypothetical protein [Kitasatospora sp. NPDC088346]|uniref:hypothetical protein n=1 Tax=Kitasatospora sp. NPDC088346 TaxID=3364073 RepID=UPI0037F1F6BF
MHDTDEPGIPFAPEIGLLLVDTRTGRVGEFRDVQDGRWWLRPRGGGYEWDVDPGDVRLAPRGDAG